jgi:hypothetical protein
MSKLTKTLLAISLVGLVAGFAFVTGFVNVGNVAALYIVLPAGAVFFGLFLISKLLEKESARYDAELGALLKTARQLDTSRPAASESARERSRNPHGRSLVSSH